MTDRTIRAVPPGYLHAEQDLPKFTYLPESDLPPLLAAEAQPWRVDGTTGEQWFRIPTVTSDDPDGDIDAELTDIDGGDDGLDYFDDDEDLDGDDDDFGEDGDDED